MAIICFANNLQIHLFSVNEKQSEDCRNFRLINNKVIVIKILSCGNKTTNRGVRYKRNESIPLSPDISKDISLVLYRSKFYSILFYFRVILQTSDKKKSAFA